MNKLYILILLSLFFNTLLANEYVVISNKNMKEISASQLKAIYLKKVVILDNIKIVAVNLKPKDKTRVSFEQEVLHMSFARLKSYWTKQHYLGRRPPLSLKSQESIKVFVKKVDGAIGYIEKINLDNDLKVIYRWKD